MQGITSNRLKGQPPNTLRVSPIRPNKTQITEEKAKSRQGKRAKTTNINQPIASTPSEAPQKSQSIRGTRDRGNGQKNLKSINRIEVTQMSGDSLIRAKMQHKLEEKGKIGKGQKDERGNQDKANGEKTQSTCETNTIRGQGVKIQELRAQNGASDRDRR